MEKNRIITTVACASAGLSLITGLVMKTVNDYAGIGAVSRMVGGGAFGTAQRIVLAFFPILFLLFQLIRKPKVAKTLGVFCALGQLLFATLIKNNVLAHIWKYDSSGSFVWTIYFILGIVALGASIVGIVTSSSSKKVKVQPTTF